MKFLNISQTPRFTKICFSKRNGFFFLKLHAPKKLFTVPLCEIPVVNLDMNHWMDFLSRAIIGVMKVCRCCFFDWRDRTGAPRVYDGLYEKRGCTKFPGRGRENTANALWKRVVYVLRPDTFPQLGIFDSIGNGIFDYARVPSSQNSWRLWTNFGHNGSLNLYSFI